MLINIDRLTEAHVGQGLDLHWKHHSSVPTEDEYFVMVDGSQSWMNMLAGLY